MFSKLSKQQSNFSRILLVFAIILTIFTSCMFIANAGKDEAQLITCTCGKEHKSSELPSGFLGKTAYVVRCTVDTGSLFAITGDISKFDMKSVLIFDISKGGAFENLWQLAETGYNSLVIVGQILATIFFALSLSEKVFSEQFNAEKLFLELVKYFMTLIILSSVGFGMITTGIEFAGEVFSRLVALNSNPFASTPGTAVCMAETIKDLSGFDCLFQILVNIVPFGAMLVAQFLVKLFAWKRILELIVRVICAPIGMADPISGGTNSPGIRYFKKILALVLQGPLIYAVSIAYASLQAIIERMVSNGDISFGWAITLLLAAVSVTLIQKTDSLSKELVGV